MFTSKCCLPASILISSPLNGKRTCVSVGQSVSIRNLPFSILHDTDTFCPLTSVEPRAHFSFLSGVISLVVYINARKHVSEYKITDAEGNVIAGEPPTFPIVGVGSIILGAILALTPNIFITALMYIIGGMLILGAINQYMNLINARKYGHIGFGYWVFPSIILITGIYVMLRPMDPASVAMLILGWCTLLYGVTELINSLKFHSDKRKLAKTQEITVAEEVADEIPEEITAEVIEENSQKADSIE